ncbi:conserved Plasmodium protein, unknown function [Plasmodium sp. gorilla clade G2]|uniref:conserved Plasmodium protein, unknown function n=1 Tax=Plasmodium sp. gorilla clade G2 TaxID=880535 RepID=UPI000D22B106|nr:conserved Plasmodium protein, unknown function [Plasmodium sp. gorilla clade G2]SOV17120.1 conserved Plasmodium protein, unknown function [Plasmodium sp. gorilla clade G2]
MKIIYEFKKEYYEIILNENNADDNVIDLFEKNINKCNIEIKPYDDINSDFLDFDQFKMVKIQNDDIKKKNEDKEDADSINDFLDKEIYNNFIVKLNDNIYDESCYKTEDELCNQINNPFDNTYSNELVIKYKEYFEENSFIVKKGDIYGADFLLYITEQKYAHSLYAVYIIYKHYILRDLIRILRVSHSIKKKVILILWNDLNCFNISDTLVYIKSYKYK